MSESVQQSIIAYAPSRHRVSPSGWISFDSPCCHRRGHNQDRKGRGGLLPAPDGAVSYNCFNCGYKASWRPGWQLNVRIRRLLSWLGAGENDIQRLQLECLRLRDEIGTSKEQNFSQEPIKFTPRSLPTNSTSYHAMATFARLNPDYKFEPDMVDQIEYLYDRRIDMKDYEFYYSDHKHMNMNRRVIVPFYWHDQLVGYTARAIDADLRPRYHSNHDANFVFNVDRQTRDHRCVIVCEGVFDAISVDGVAVLSNRINDTQAEIIESLDREVIVVPDFDPSGRELVAAALEYGWSVSFPVWAADCKDINAAVIKYGRLFVLKSILESRENNRLRIQLLERKFFRESKNK